MPELPEVEAARRRAERHLGGRRIVAVAAVPDRIVIEGTSSRRLAAALRGRRVVALHRRGKHLWFELDRRPWPLFHFGMSGSFRLYHDGDPRPRFWKVELAVDLVNVAAPCPYDPEPVCGGVDLTASFTSPTGVPWEANGFHNGSAWLVRFAPDEIGQWRYTVSVRDWSGSAVSGEQPFSCVSSSNPGWLRINGRFLRDSATGEIFFGVGHNNGWVDDLEQPGFVEMVDASFGK